MVAHEVAIQLKFAGERVTLVIMDTYPPDPDQPHKPADTDIAEKDPELIHMLDMIKRQDERASDVLRDIIRGSTGIMWGSCASMNLASSREISCS